MSPTHTQPKAASVRHAWEQRIDAARDFVDVWLDRILPTVGSPPSRLHLAMREAVFPGGKRTRPVLAVLVASTYPSDPSRNELVGRMAAAVELVHCASLVHDDLPAFDDADTRRGSPSCHAAFGEPTAILVGDALLTLAFEVIAHIPLEHAQTAMRMARLVAEATGSRSGIIGGQGLELQTNVDLAVYHSQKTSSLFRAAAAGGALAAGHEADMARWSRFGELLGRALQIRDDMDDCLGSAQTIGKPVGRDAALGRPNVVNQSSVDEARRWLARMASESYAIVGAPTETNATLHALVTQVSGMTPEDAHAAE